SGFNLVTSAIRNGRRLIGVVMGGQTSSQRDHAMMRLLDNGFATQIPALEAAYTPIAVAFAIATTEEGGVDPSGADQSSADPSGESNWGIQVGAFGKLALAQQ